MIDPTILTIKDAVELIGKKQIKAKELTGAFLDRAHKVNKKLNAYYNN